MKVSPYKRILTLIAALSILTLAAVACSSDDSTTPADNALPVNGITVTPADDAVSEDDITVTPADDALPGDGITVQPARATWDTGYFNEALYSRALETLGYDVKDFLELDNPIFYQQVALGEIDYWANGWFPAHSQYEDLFSDGAEIAGTVIPVGGLEGYLVDKAGADEFGIKTLADFERPEVAAAYDTDGNGKANLVGCPAGWGCNEIQIYQWSDLELEAYIDRGTADYSAAMADLIARYNNGEHVLFYTWTPNWTVDVLSPGEDVVWIGVPRASSPLDITEADQTHSGIVGAVVDPLLTGWSASDIQVVANSEFLDENPAAAKLFEVMGLPLADVSNQSNRMSKGEDSQTDIEGHVDEWIAENQSTWDSWIEQAKTAA